MAKYSFKGVGIPGSKESRHRLSITGPGFQRRVAFFRRYFPSTVMAKMMARQWNITPGAEHYSQGIMEGIRRIGKDVKEAMHVRRVSRERALAIVWRSYRDLYVSHGVEIASASDLFREWITDNVSP